MPYKILLVLIIIKRVFFFFFGFWGVGRTENGLKTTSPFRRGQSPFGLINGLGRNGFTVHTNSQHLLEREHLGKTPLF